MNTHSESGNLNGSATLYLLIGRIESDVKHLRSDVTDVREKVDKLERNARRKIIPVPKGWISSLGLTGKELIILAFAAGLGATGTLTPEMVRAALFGH
jgi:hypothetical protein